MEREIPKAIIDAFEKRLCNTDYTISILGKYKGKSVYVASYNYFEIGGLPDVFLYDGEKCEFAGFEGPVILRHFASYKS